MDDQRCSLQKIPRPESSPKKDLSLPGVGPPRSASFSPGSDIERPMNHDKASSKNVYVQLTVFMKEEKAFRFKTMF